MNHAIHTTTDRRKRATTGKRAAAWCVLIAVLGFVASAAWTSASHAATHGYRVVVHPESSVSTTNRRFLTEAFLKKVTEWPDGTKIHPIDLRQSSGVRESFSSDVLGRSVSGVGHYWLQVIFAGRGVPPPELSSEDQVVGFVLSHPGAVGYVSENTDLRGAKVLVVR